MSEATITKRPKSFSRAFLPGLVLGLVVGLAIGAFVPPLLERPASVVTPPGGSPSTRTGQRERPPFDSPEMPADPADERPEERPTERPEGAPPASPQ